MTSPLAFYGLSYAVGVHQHISGVPGAVKHYTRPLGYKSQLIRLVNGTLTTLESQTDIEMVMLAIFILWKVNIQETDKQQEDGLLFNSHLPGATWLSVYGKADVVDQHAGAVRWLVERSGGLQGLQHPGLALVVEM